MSRIFVCDNVYTLLVAVIMKKQMFYYDDVDIIINNRTPESEKRALKLRELKLFRNVYYFATFSCYDSSKKLKMYLKKTNCIFRGCDKYVHELVLDYDDIYTLHADCLTNIIAWEMQKNNTIVKVHYIEEGFGSYTNSFKEMEFVKKLSARAICEKIAKKTIKYIPARDLITDMFVFDPKLMMWEPPFPIIKLDTPDFEKYPELKEEINYIFSLERALEEYKGKKIIYFEDSVSLDSGDNSDLKIVDFISSFVNKEQFIVKLHPRTRLNRFINKYNTNKIQGIPWEVIAMNMDDEDSKAFVTITSGSIIGTSLILSQKPRCVMLYKCLPERRTLSSPYLFDFIEKYAKEYPDYLLIPNTLEEAKEEIECLINN